MNGQTEERVKGWNSYLRLARDAGVALKQSVDPNWETTPWKPLGGELSETDKYSLALMAWCCLALEARTNHLIRELQEREILTTEEADAALRVQGLKERWALLPRLARRRRNVDFGRIPHQSVSELSKIRNNLVHFRFERMDEWLSNEGKVISLFNNFVDAMEDMNVILGRVRSKRKGLELIKLD